MSGAENVGGAISAGAPASQQRRSRQRPGLRGWLERPYVLRTLSLTVLLVGWQLFGNKFSTSFPIDIGRAAVHQFGSDVVPAFKDTLTGFFSGYAFCVLVGIPIGLLMAQFRVVELALEPYVAALYATPRLALIPVLILWFGVNFQLRFAVVVISGLFPIILNTYIGGKEVDRDLLDVGTAFAAGRFQTLRTIVVPGSLSYIFAGMKLGMARAFIGIIVAEIETSVLGVGNLINKDVQELNFAGMWVAIISLGIFSIAFTVVLKRIENWTTMPWLRKGRRAPWPLRG